MTDIEKLRKDILSELENDILPYWMLKMHDPAGGYYGRRDGLDRLDAAAERGAILNARILWTFASAYNRLCRHAYLQEARHAYKYLREHFIDPDFGGAYWAVDSEGNPSDTKKQFYAIAFVIYGLAEYYEASGDAEALALALKLFDSIESHSRDRELGGYFEAATRDWQPIADMRLSEKDDNAPKTMNTHLHILEAYSNLYRVMPKDAKEAPVVKEALASLIGIFLDRIIAPDGSQMNLFFAYDWTPRGADISFGHDIEASWLLHEAALNLGEPEVTRRVERAVMPLARGAMRGFNREEGWMAYEQLADGHRDEERHWWVQAETVSGLLWLASRLASAGKNGTDTAGKEGMMTPAEKEEMIDKAAKTFGWIMNNLIDPDNGEWYWSRFADGTINRRDDKAGFWKCPYHNARMCLEANAALKFVISE